jgi:hypothetical protein
VKILAALTTPSLPLSLWHFGLAAPHGPGSNLQAPAFPYPIVAMPWPHQSMGNFMQDCVQKLFLGVAEDEVDGKLDGAATVDAYAQGPLAAVEGESPVMEAMLNQEAMSEASDLLNPVGEYLFWTDRPGDWFLSSGGR